MVVGRISRDAMQLIPKRNCAENARILGAHCEGVQRGSRRKQGEIAANRTLTDANSGVDGPSSDVDRRFCGGFPCKKGPVYPTPYSDLNHVEPS